MQQVKGSGHLRRLAVLHMADHVPADVPAGRVRRQIGLLLQSLLDVILAKVHLTNVGQSSDVRCRMQLGYGHQSHLGAGASGPVAGGLQPFLQVLVASQQCVVHAFIPP